MSGVEKVVEPVECGPECPYCEAAQILTKESEPKENQTMTIKVTGNVERAALAEFGHDAISLLRHNITAQILAKASGKSLVGPDGMVISLIDPTAPLDERIRWSSESRPDGVYITGELDEEPANV